MTDLTPGTRYRDRDGDTWTVLADERNLIWDQSPGNIDPLVQSFAITDSEYGPLVLIDHVADLHRALDDGQYKPGCPDYYRFPHGTQVIEIARYLTSNAGQAVQYIARSSRLDGNNKGDRVGDLRKAVNMMLDEIERLEAEKDAP